MLSRIIFESIVFFAIVIGCGYAADNFVRQAKLKWTNAGPVIAIAIAAAILYFLHQYDAFEVWNS